MAASPAPPIATSADDILSIFHARMWKWMKTHVHRRRASVNMIRRASLRAKRRSWRVIPARRGASDSQSFPQSGEANLESNSGPPGG
eukprot:4210001-Pyramimonas_sp.AAC.1